MRSNLQPRGPSFFIGHLGVLKSINLAWLIERRRKLAVWRQALRFVDPFASFAFFRRHTLGVFTLPLLLSHISCRLQRAWPEDRELEDRRVLLGAGTMP